MFCDDGSETQLCLDGSCVTETNEACDDYGGDGDGDGGEHDAECVAWMDQLCANCGDFYCENQDWRDTAFDTCESIGFESCVIECQAHASSCEQSTACSTTCG